MYANDSAQSSCRKGEKALHFMIELKTITEFRSSEGFFFVFVKKALHLVL